MDVRFLITESKVTPEEKDTFDKLNEPAPVITNAGTKCWYDEIGELHRKNGPAVIFNDGHVSSWWRHGKLHRPTGDGPAVIWGDGRTEYWENGIRIE